MPTVYNTFGGIQGTISASSSGNRVTSVVKAGGTNSNFTEVAVYTPSGIDGNSNDGISTAFITASTAIQYASGTGIGAADDIRKLVDIRIDNVNLANQDGIMGVDSIKTLGIESSGLIRLRNGTLVSPTGAAIEYSALGAKVVGSGADINLVSQYDGQGERYHFKMGSTITEETLSTRSQL